MGLFIYEDHFFRLFGISLSMFVRFWLAGEQGSLQRGVVGFKRRRVVLFSRHLRWTYCYAAQ